MLFRRRGASSLTIDFVNFLVEPRPTYRPDASQALQHPWFKSASPRVVRFSLRNKVTIPRLVHHAGPGIIQIAQVNSNIPGQHLLVLTPTDLTLVKLSLETSSPSVIVASYPWEADITRSFTKFVFPCPSYNKHVILATQDDRFISLSTLTLEPISHIDIVATLAGLLAPFPPTLYEPDTTGDANVRDPCEFFPIGHTTGQITMWRYRRATGHLLPFYPDGRALTLPAAIPGCPIPAVIFERTSIQPSTTLRIAQYGTLYRMKFVDGADSGAEPRLDMDVGKPYPGPEVEYEPWDCIDMLTGDEHRGTFPVVARQWGVERQGQCDVFASWGGKGDELSDWVELQRKDHYELVAVTGGGCCMSTRRSPSLGWR
jgi:hypothetical protein